MNVPARRISLRFLLALLLCLLVCGPPLCILTVAGEDSSSSSSSSSSSGDGDSSTGDGSSSTATEGSSSTAIVESSSSSGDSSSSSSSSSSSGAWLDSSSSSGTFADLSDDSSSSSSAASGNGTAPVLLGGSSCSYLSSRFGAQFSFATMPILVFLLLLLVLASRVARWQPLPLHVQSVAPQGHCSCCKPLLATKEGRGAHALLQLLQLGAVVTALVLDRWAATGDIVAGLLSIRVGGDALPLTSCADHIVGSDASLLCLSVRGGGGMVFACGLLASLCAAGVLVWSCRLLFCDPAPVASTGPIGATTNIDGAVPPALWRLSCLTVVCSLGFCALYALPVFLSLWQNVSCEMQLSTSWFLSAGSLVASFYLCAYYRRCVEDFPAGDTGGTISPSFRVLRPPVGAESGLFGAPDKEVELARQLRATPQLSSASTAGANSSLLLTDRSGFNGGADSHRSLAAAYLQPQHPSVGMGLGTGMSAVDRAAAEADPHYVPEEEQRLADALRIEREQFAAVRGLSPPSAHGSSPYAIADAATSLRLASPSQRNMVQLSWSPHQPAAERQQQQLQLQLQMQQPQYSSCRNDALSDWPATAPSSLPASSRRYMVHSPQTDSSDGTAAGMADSQWHPSQTPQGSNPFPAPLSGRLSLPAHLVPGTGTGAGTAPHTPTRVLGLSGGSSAASAVSSARVHSRRETHEGGYSNGGAAAASNRRMLPPVHSARQSSTLLAQFSTPANTHRRA
jgi:hypothetical protein